SIRTRKSRLIPPYTFGTRIPPPAISPPLGMTSESLRPHRGRLYDRASRPACYVDPLLTRLLRSKVAFRSFPRSDRSLGEEREKALRPVRRLQAAALSQPHS